RHLRRLPRRVDHHPPRARRRHLQPEVAGMTRLHAAIRFTAAASLAALLSATGACHLAELAGPPELRLGRDQCIECGMIINEDRFSSAALIDNTYGQREHILFDDVGCMLDYQREHPGIAFIDLFAHDADTRDWITTQQATFLLADSSAILTPMGSGIAAYGDRGAARGAQARHGGACLRYGGRGPLGQAWVLARMGGAASPDGAR